MKPEEDDRIKQHPPQSIFQATYHQSLYSLFIQDHVKSFSKPSILQEINLDNRTTVKMKFQAILYPVVLALSYGAGSVVAATLPVRQDPTPVGAVDSVVTWGAE